MPPLASAPAARAESMVMRDRPIACMRLSDGTVSAISTLRMPVSDGRKRPPRAVAPMFQSSP